MEYKRIISLQQTLWESFRAGRLSKKSYIIRLRELLNHKIIFAEHIVCVFPENIITRFDVSVNDVSEEFAKKLRIWHIKPSFLGFAKRLKVF